MALRLMVVSHTYMEAQPRQKWFTLRDVDPDCDIAVVTPKRWHEPEFNWLWRAQPYSEKRIQFIPIAAVFDGFVSRHIYSISALVSTMRSFRPDIIQVEAEPWSAVYLQIALLRRLFVPDAKLMFFTWWNTPRVIPFPFSVTHQWCLACTAGVIAGNHGALDVLAQHGYRGSVAIIPQLGVDDTLYTPGVPSSVLMQRYDLQSRFVIGFVGRLTRRKGIDTLLEAAAKLTDLDWRLLLIGDGPERTALAQASTRLGIADKVIFAGSVSREEMPAHMRCLDVLVLPSTQAQWEQFGHVLIEAMACGVPVVGSESGEIPRVIGDAGIVFPIGDSRALADALRRVGLEPGLAKLFRERGRERVRTHFTHSAIAHKLSGTYRSVYAGAELATGPGTQWT